MRATSRPVLTPGSNDSPEADMRNKLMIVIACVALSLSASAQMKVKTRGARPLKTAAPNAQNVAAAKRISPQEALTMFRANKAVIVDVRSNDSFALGHIRGAVNIPGSQLLARLRELPAGKMIITYCACSAEQSSGRAVVELNGHGLQNTAAMQGGWHAWQNAGLPTAIGRQ